MTSLSNGIPVIGRLANVLVAQITLEKLVSLFMQMGSGINGIVAMIVVLKLKSEKHASNYHFSIVSSRKYD